MARIPLEIRMAKLEGTYEQINKRLGAIEQLLTLEVSGVRSEITALRKGIQTGMRDGPGSFQLGFGSVRSEIAEFRRQSFNQFCWLLMFLLVSIIIPLLRDGAR